MSRRSQADEIRLPSDEEPIAAVTILDGQGRVVRVVPACEFRRTSKGDPELLPRNWRRGRKSP
jgi:hypothetical protein